MATTVIFDLDGTLADSLPIVIEVVNDLKITDRVFTRTDYERVKNLSIKAILKDLGIPIWRVPGIVMKGRAALTHRIAEVPLFPGMQEVVKSLSKKGCKLYLMSSNSHANIELFLQQQGIREYFEVIQGGVSIFGKAAALKKITKEHQLDQTSTYYIGDEVRDVEAAKKARLHSVAVTWGYNGDQILQAYRPEHLVRTPADLRAIFA